MNRAMIERTVFHRKIVELWNMGATIEDISKIETIPVWDVSWLISRYLRYGRES